jgi:hypothetical protein
MSSQYPPPPEPQGYPGMPMPGEPAGQMPGMPPAAPGAQPPAQRPGSIATAVKLMYAGAALSLLSAALTPTMGDGIRQQIEDAMANQDNPMTPDQIDGFVTVALGVGVVFALLGVGLWLLMAWANGKGRTWARIVATVLFGLNAVSFLSSLVQAGTAPLLTVVSLLTVLVGAGAVFLLWKKESSAYYQAQSAPRY